MSVIEYLSFEVPLAGRLLNCGDQAFPVTGKVAEAVEMWMDR
jgi:hypothetical protein